jgi:uncharacterized protein (DUF924 family)
MDVTPDAVIDFWREAGRDRWYAKDEGFDLACTERFGAAVEAALAGRLDAWAEDAGGRLALVLLLDQFPRNIRRGTPGAFAGDSRARAVARRAIAEGDHRQVAPELRAFLIMPFMHAEDLADQDLCVALVEAMGDTETLPHAIGHRDIVRRFGRFPHRNAILGRVSTPEEIAYLADPNTFKG